MTRLQAGLRRAVEDLHALGVRYALVGGLAVSARTEPRTTRDIDFAVAVESDRHAEQVVFELQQRGYRVDVTLEQVATGRLATARLFAPGETGARVDLLFASSGIEQEVVAAAESLQVTPHLEAPVAALAHLLALKILARDDRARPQDAVDIRAILQSATAADIDVGRALLRRVTERGFNRNRDLDRELDAALEQFRDARI
jgi:predicted nucleotidyltransferase